MQSKIIFKTLAVILFFTLYCPFPLSNQSVSRSHLVSCLAPGSVSEQTLMSGYQKIGLIRESHPIKLKTVKKLFLTRNGRRLRSSGWLLMNSSGEQLLSFRVSYKEIVNFARTEKPSYLDFEFWFPRYDFNMSRGYQSFYRNDKITFFAEKIGEESDVEIIRQANFPACTVPFFCDPAMRVRATKSSSNALFVAKLNTISLDEYLQSESDLEKIRIFSDKLALAVREVMQSPVGRVFLASLSDSQRVSMNYMGVDYESGEIYFTDIALALSRYLEADKPVAPESLDTFFGVMLKKSLLHTSPEFIKEWKRYLLDLQEIGPGGDSGNRDFVVGTVTKTRNVRESGHTVSMPQDIYGTVMKDEWIVDEPAHEEEYTENVIETRYVNGPQDIAIEARNKEFMEFLSGVAKSMPELGISSDDIKDWQRQLVLFQGNRYNVSSLDFFMYFSNRLAELSDYFNSAVTEAA